MCSSDLTGTVQNPHGENHAVFFAFAPRHNPKIAIAVFVENAGYGGTWAAPIASMLVEKYLKDTITLPKYIQDRVYNANLLPKPKKPKETEVKKDSTKNPKDSTKNKTTAPLKSAARDPKKEQSAVLVHHSQVRRTHE